MTSADAELVVAAGASSALAGEAAGLDGWRDETALFGTTGCWAPFSSNQMSACLVEELMIAVVVGCNQPSEFHIDDL